MRSEHLDTDGDGVGQQSLGNSDDDGDGVVDTGDAFPLDPTEVQLILTNDGIGNNRILTTTGRGRRAYKMHSL